MDAKQNYYHSTTSNFMTLTLPKLGQLRLRNLERLPSNGSLIDLLDYTRCSELRYTDDDPSDDPNILHRLRSNEAELSLLLRAVKSVRFEVAPHLWLSELEIIDIRERALEGIKFLVQSQNGDGLTCYCEDIECLSFEEGAATRAR
jgi:hypothetical protein